MQGRLLHILTAERQPGKEHALGGGNGDPLGTDPDDTADADEAKKAGERGEASGFKSERAAAARKADADAAGNRAAWEHALCALRHGGRPLRAQQVSAARRACGASPMLLWWWCSGIVSMLKRRGRHCVPHVAPRRP